MQASITLQYNTLHFFCLYRPPPNRRNNLTDSMFTEQLPDLLDYVNSLPGFVCLVGDMNIHFDNPLQSLTKQTLSTLSLYDLVQVINKPTHRCGHIIDWVIVRPDDDIHRKSTVTDSLESDHYWTKSYFNISVEKPSTLYRTVRNIANIDRPSFIAELSSVSEFSSVENANQFCDFLRLPMSSRITIHLKSLHWLPVKVRSTYKIACLCYHCHSSTAPSYVTDMLHKKPLHTRNTRSSSYTMPLLNRPAHSKATLGDRSFSFASSSVWNSIPNDVKCAPSLSSFKSRLKTYLFRSVYKD